MFKEPMCLHPLQVDHSDAKAAQNLEKRSARDFVKYFDELDEDPLK